METFITQIRDYSIDEAFNQIKNNYSNISKYENLTGKYKLKGVDLLTFIVDTLKYNNKISTYLTFAICMKDPKEDISVKIDYISPAGNAKQRVWATKYLVRGKDLIEKFNKKSDANSFARDYTLKSKTGVEVHMTKELVNGDSLITKMKYNKSESKTKGEWLFFGYE